MTGYNDKTLIFCPRQDQDETQLFQDESQDKT